MSQKICVYAICKNELKFIDKWLENMSEADYIVVLDTGSTDGTFEKLQQDPRVTRVEQEVITPWRFDVARNRSMDLIPDDADILVCTDFDELFEPGWGQYLRDNWVPGYHNRCHYKYAWAHDPQGRPEFVFTYDKIHTRDFNWIFPVHEVLWPLNENEYVETVLKAEENIYLHHWQDLTKNRASYLELLKLSCEENPNSSHVWSLLAREHLNNEDYEDSLQVCLDTLDKPDIETVSNGLVLLQTLLFTSMNYFYLGNYEEAEWYCQEFIRVNPTYREPYFLLGSIYNEQRLYQLAEAMVFAGRKYGVQKYDWVELEKTWTTDDYSILGAVYLNMQNYEDAAQNLKQVINFEPENNAALKQYILALENQLNKLAQK